MEFPAAFSAMYMPAQLKQAVELRQRQETAHRRFAAGQYAAGSAPTPGSGKPAARRIRYRMHQLRYRQPPAACWECGAEIGLDAPLRTPRRQVLAMHGAWHADMVDVHLAEAVRIASRTALTVVACLDLIDLIGDGPGRYEIAVAAAESSARTGLPLLCSAQAVLMIEGKWNAAHGRGNLSRPGTQRLG
jgi:hypothetical protein